MIFLPRQIKTMAMSHDDYKESIFYYAASNKSPNVLGAIMSGIEKDIIPQEVWNKCRFGIHPCHKINGPIDLLPSLHADEVTFTINDRYRPQYIVLYYFVLGMILWWKRFNQGKPNNHITRPAKRIKRNVSKAYVKLYPSARTLAVTQMETLLLQRGFRGRSLLSTAAQKGDNASFEAVLDALRTRLTPDQVRSFRDITYKWLSTATRYDHTLRYVDTRYCT